MSDAPQDSGRSSVGNPPPAMPPRPTAPGTTPPGFAPAEPVHVAAWPSEKPLFALLLLASMGMWAVLFISVVGIIYAGLIMLALFLSHLVFVTAIRGSAIRLGPEQLPELYERVVTLSKRAGLKAPPEAYLLESGGQLNAFATRFLGRPMMVLYSDLLDACDGDDGARDMIIGHEIGHIRAGHLPWLWVLAPGSIIPFLGAAYSRAREYTCDRWGTVLCNDRQAATRGLTLLAAGKRSAPHVNKAAFVAQARDLDTGWMTLGRWLSSYPPLCERVAALDPGLADSPLRTGKGSLRALAVMGGLFLMPVAGLALATAVMLPSIKAAFDQLETGRPEYLADDGDLYEEVQQPVFDSVEEFEAAEAQAKTDLADLMGVLEQFIRESGEPPMEIEEVEATWDSTMSRPFPTDPFDGFPYGFSIDETEILLWSSGPDGESLTDDDIQVRKLL